MEEGKPEQPSSAQQERKVCLIIPCYNEARRLDAAAFRAFLLTNLETRLLFVDDGSRDQTMQVLENLCAGFEDSASLLHLPQNGGKAEAVRQGILQALERFSPQFVGFWDADLATPLKALQDFLNVLVTRPGIEMVFGARVQLLGRQVKRSASRHYLGRVFATAVSIALQMPVYDTQCGAKLFRVDPITRQVFATPFLSKWVFDVEIIARYRKLFTGAHRSLFHAIYEAPLERWTDVAGSKVHPGDFFLAFGDIFRIWRQYR